MLGTFNPSLATLCGSSTCPSLSLFLLTSTCVVSLALLSLTTTLLSVLSTTVLVLKMTLGGLAAPVVPLSHLRLTPRSRLTLTSKASLAGLFTLVVVARLCVSPKSSPSGLTALLLLKLLVVLLLILTLSMLATHFKSLGTLSLQL